LQAIFNQFAAETNAPVMTVDAEGVRRWTVNGKAHRDDGPALEYPDGTKVWFQFGMRHRADGPAVEYANGDKIWMINDKQHREGGPAVESKLNVQWFVHGKLHRIDGPAVVYSAGTKEWWVNGEKHRTGAPAVEHSDGSTEWWKNGVQHREDGPAVEWAADEDLKQWYLNGQEFSEAEYKTELCKLGEIKRQENTALMSSVRKGTQAQVKAPALARFRK
jgi:hypothetical protein